MSRGDDRKWVHLLSYEVRDFAVVLLELILLLESQLGAQFLQAVNIWFSVLQYICVSPFRLHHRYFAKGFAILQ